MSAVEIRESAPGKLVLRGHASVSERWYPVGRAFDEKVNRGTWRRSLSEAPDVVLLQDHGGLGFARTKTPSGTPSLRLKETDYGLEVEADLDGTAPRVQDLRSTLENVGLQMSVAFTCTDDRWSEDGKRRELKAANLHRGDVTVCNFGANEATDVSISERGGLSTAEQRSFIESLKGSRERRMCPDFTVSESSSGLKVASRSKVSVPRSTIARDRAHRAKVLAESEMPPELRASKYTQSEVNALGREGKAFKDPSGSYSYPIADAQDLSNAIRTVGRGNASHEAIRRFIRKRARELKLTKMIPPTWRPDGSLGE